jgi:hypothetical protein
LSEYPAATKRQWVFEKKFHLSPACPEMLRIDARESPYYQRLAASIEKTRKCLSEKNISAIREYSAILIRKGAVRARDFETKHAELRRLASALRIRAPGQ